MGARPALIRQKRRDLQSDDDRLRGDARNSSVMHVAVPARLEQEFPSGYPIPYQERHRYVVLLSYLLFYLTCCST
jgi:hypothetical protein